MAEAWRLKIYVYGYLNRLQSSRRLERETQRNVELMRLTGRLTPDFKTIGDFRKDNGKAIRSVGRRIHRAVPPAQSVLGSDRGYRRLRVQGGQQSGQELHRQQAQEARGAAGGKHKPLSGRARSRGSEPTLVTEDRVSRLKKKVATVKAHMEKVVHSRTPKRQGRVDLSRVASVHTGGPFNSY